MFQKTLSLGAVQVPHSIIQGGMAVRISTAQLAGAVASQGGIGVIAGTTMTVEELRGEIVKAKELAGGRGAIGLNVLFAVKNFAELVKEAMKSGIDVVFSGAGFSRDIFNWGREFNVPIVPIVSSGKLAKMSEKLGAAAVVVEGVEAGGHLGTDKPLEAILPEVREATKLPLIAAGGIMTGEDILRIEKMGADGVQLGTIFAASEESNASDYFKSLYLEAGPDATALIESPVGLKGRALINTFTEKLMRGNEIDIEGCDACLKICSQIFCIRQVLENAQEGVGEDRLVFSGKNVHLVKEILPVSEIFQKLKEDYEVAIDKK